MTLHSPNKKDTEFTMMGILPYVATDLGISIPVAGHFISAYALGVCFGAPMLLLARKRPLKQILLVLMALMIVGNICASMAPNYWVLLLGRFVSEHHGWGESKNINNKITHIIPCTTVPTFPGEIGRAHV